MKETALLQKEDKYKWINLDEINKYLSEGWIDTQLRRQYLFK